MNKISTLLLLAIILLMGGGCKKENIIDSLKGTSWSGVTNKLKAEIQFTETKKCYIKDGGLTKWYNYHMTDQKSAFLEPEKFGYSFDCSFNSTTLVLRNTKTGELAYVVHKQTSHTVLELSLAHQ